MTLNVSQENGISILAIDGAIDSSKSGILEERINQLLVEGQKNILLDFADLEYTSSAGLRVFLSTAQKLKAAGGRFALCELNENVKEVFELSQLSDILRIFNKRAEAVAAGLK